MLYDANQGDFKNTTAADICLIGAGAAGIAIAKEFINSNKKVILLEGGGLEYNSSSQILYDGENVGQPYFHPLACRLRLYGGTTNHWAGYCRPFEDYDFKVKNWIPNSGWPITLSDISDYYKRAAILHQMPEAGWDLGYWRDFINEPLLPIYDSDVFSKVALIKPIRFGHEFRQEIKKSENVHLLYGANVTELNINQDANRVTDVNVVTLAGGKFNVLAKHFVLCAGGIENARILLASNSRLEEGVGNKFDLVGRYFMDHIRVESGIIQPLDSKFSTKLYNIHKLDDLNLSFTLSVSESAQKLHQINSTGVRIRAVYDENILLNKTYKKIKSIQKDIIELLRSLGKNNLITRKNISSVMTDLYKSAGIRKYIKDRLPIDYITCIIRVEPVPNPLSRIKLGNEKDALGVRKVQVDWQLSDIDRRSADVTMEILAKSFGQANLGRVKTTVSENWPANITANYHHMGTTKMSADPKTGVVDKNCKVWGIDNLFLAGSSVFATSGSGTPTYTISALAIRLADHLKSLLN